MKYKKLINTLNQNQMLIGYSMYDNNKNEIIVYVKSMAIHNLLSKYMTGDYEMNDLMFMMNEYFFIRQNYEI